MGLTSVRMQVANFAAPEIAEEVEFLVDSGAIYSVVPGELLARLGLAPRREREFRLANATRIVRGCGVAPRGLGRRGPRSRHAPVASPSARRAVRVTTVVTATVAARPRTRTA